MKSRYQFGFLPILILLIGLGAMLATLFSIRDISIGEGDMFENAMMNANPIADSISRFLTAIILAMCGFKIWSVIRQDQVPGGGSGILFYYLLFFLCATLFTALLGHRGDFDIKLLYAPIALAAVYVTRPMPTDNFLSLSKYILLIYMYGSLLATVLAPSWALMGTYESLLPGVETRLFGVATHANQLGPLAAAYLVIELLKPTRTKLRVIHLVITLVVLIWAQSKTAWGFVLLATLYFLFAKIESVLFPNKNARMNFPRVLLYGLGVMVGVSLFAIVAGLTNVIPAYSSTGVESLTGRTTIWTITFDAWAPNPIFGYGLSLWNTDFRAQYGLFNVGHAHSQFVHTLGSSGLIGLFGLLIYLGALFKRSIQVAKTNPVALALFGLIVVDCVTETPLSNTGILNAYFFLHLLLFSQLRSVK